MLTITFLTIQPLQNTENKMSKTKTADATTEYGRRYHRVRQTLDTQKKWLLRRNYAKNPTSPKCL